MAEIFLLALVGILVGFSKGGLGGPVPVALTVPMMTLIIRSANCRCAHLAISDLRRCLRALLLLEAMGSTPYQAYDGARLDRRTCWRHCAERY